MRRGWAVLATALALWTAGAGSALACRFIPAKDPVSHLARADVAFVGRVIGTRPVRGQPGEVETRFKVTRTLKGPAAPVRLVQQNTMTTCGNVDFRPGQTVLVLAVKVEGRLATSIMLAPQFPVADYERAARKVR